jgi:hypothetical protein
MSAFNAVTMWSCPASVSIDVYTPWPGPTADNASAWVENYPTDWPDFRLIDRSQVTVSGYIAESDTWVRGGLATFGREPGALEFKKKIVFNRNGLRWYIELACDSIVSDKATAEFDAIVASIKVIE